MTCNYKTASWCRSSPPDRYIGAFTAPHFLCVCHFVTCLLSSLVHVADRQTNMHMNQPVWIVEDKALKNSEEGRKKLQQVADDHSKAKSSSRLTIVHGGDFDKVGVHVYTHIYALYHFRQEKLACMHLAYNYLSLDGIAAVT